MLAKWRMAPTLLLLPRFAFVHFLIRSHILTFPQFINNGFQCMTTLLNECQKHLSDPEVGQFRRVRELFRVLIHVSQPFRESLSTLPTVASPVQEAFLQALDERLKVLENMDLEDDDAGQSREKLVISLRMLQFVLSFKCPLTGKSKELLKHLSHVVFSWILVSFFVARVSKSCSSIQQRCTSDDSFDINLYPLLIDTLLVILDGTFCQLNECHTIDTFGNRTLRPQRRSIPLLPQDTY